MIRLIASICLVAFVAEPSNDGFREYRAVETYEIRPGVVITPSYSASHDLCEISIEKRHYSHHRVDMDSAMSKEQILDLFHELVPKEERGGTSGRLPANTEISESDLGMLSTRIPYENVILTMFGLKDTPDRQHYIVATISWNKTPCSASIAP